MKADLPHLYLINERFWNAIKDELTEEEKKYCSPFDFNMTVFLQTWKSTALGFSGIDGSATTKAYTTIVKDVRSGWCGVFFGENLAYKIKQPNKEFDKDMHNFCMKPIYEADAYLDSTN